MTQAPSLPTTGNAHQKSNLGWLLWDKPWQLCGLISAIVASVVFTLLVVRWSTEHGRLSTLANWDDSMYLTHGCLSAANLQERGVIKFLGFERSWPPHSVYADLECVAG